MSDTSFNLRVKDVYDIAIDIANEFEKLVNAYGIDDISIIVNKVIRVLEYLENSVNKIEDLEKEVSELKLKYIQVSSEKITCEENKLRLQQDYVDVEKSWVLEAMELKSVICKLREDNKHLQINLDARNEASADESSEVILYEQKNLISKLKYLLQQQEKELQKYINDNELLNGKISRLHEVNKTLHHRYQETKNKIRHYEIEKRDFQSKLLQQEQKIASLETMLTESISSNAIENSANGFNNLHDNMKHVTCPHEDMINLLLSDQIKLKEDIKKLESQLNTTKDIPENEETSFFPYEPLSSSTFQKSSGIRQLFHLFLEISTFVPFSFI